MKREIDQKKSTLKEREKKILNELEISEQKIKKRAKSIGKIALATGVVALLSYWFYNTFFADSGEEEEKETTKAKAHKKSGRISQLVTPYLVDYFGRLLELKKEKEQ